MDSVGDDDPVFGHNKCAHCTAPIRGLPLLLPTGQ
jgi:hypothetical protein